MLVFITGNVPPTPSIIYYLSFLCIIFHHQPCFPSFTFFTFHSHFIHLAAFAYYILPSLLSAILDTSLEISRDITCLSYVELFLTSCAFWSGYSNDLWILSHNALNIDRFLYFSQFVLYVLHLAKNCLNDYHCIMKHGISSLIHTYLHTYIHIKESRAINSKTTTPKPTE